MGAVRVGLIEGDLVVNGSMQEMEESKLDLLVVGTKEALTMVEAGAEEVPEETILEAFALAQKEIVKLCEAQEELRSRVGKPKWLDNELTAELEKSQGKRLRERIAELGLREAAVLVEEITSEIAPTLSMDSSEEDIVRRSQVRTSLHAILEREQLAAVQGPVQEQFGKELRALTDAEQDSKELRAAKRQLLVDSIVEGVELPFPAGPAPAEGEAPIKDQVTKTFIRKSTDAIYKDLIRQKIAVDKRRPDGRGTEEIRPITCEV